MWRGFTIPISAAEKGSNCTVRFVQYKGLDNQNGLFSREYVIVYLKSGTERNCRWSYRFRILGLGVMRRLLQ